MNKKKFITGWFGEDNENIFYKSNDHPSSGLSEFIQNFIENIKKLTLKEDIEIHLNSQFSLSKKRKYLILLEHKYIRPQNYFIFPRRYRKVFGWDLNLRKYANFIYLKYPHSLGKCNKNLNRKLRYTMISSNRNILCGVDKFSLYNKRQNVIDFCEEYNNLDFYLYGKDWENRNIKSGFFDFFLQILSKKSLLSLKRKKRLKNYKGIAKNKSRILQNSKFNFCFENIVGYKGYISEKIWDSIANGAIPVYWPSWEIPEDYIPKEYYVNASNFRNMNELFKYLESISEEEIISWSNKLIDFSKIKKEDLSIEKYSGEIIKNIIKDLEEINIISIPWKLKSKIFSIIDFFNLSQILYYFQKFITRNSLKKSISFNPLWDFHKNNLIKYKKNGSIIEFGAGKSLGQNLYLSNIVKKQYLFDIKNMLDFDLVQKSQIFLAKEKGQIFNYKINNINDLMKYNIYYKAPADVSKTNYKNDSIDACISTDTLEHIPVNNLKQILIEIKRILKKGGLVSMIIDYSDHYSHTDKNIHPLNFLRFNENIWNKKYNHKCHFQNRLRHSDYKKLLIDIGFNITYEKIIKKADSMPAQIFKENNKTYNDNMALSGYFLAIKN